MQYWVLILSTEKALILVAGMILAYSTRNVKLEELNDSKLLTIIIYNFLMVLIVSGPLRSILNRMPGDSYFLLDTMLIWCSVTMMLGLLFFGQYYHMKKKVKQRIESLITVTPSVDG